MPNRSIRALAVAVTIAMLAGCASLPPAMPSTDLKLIAGKWQGTLQTRQGQARFTQTIHADGTIETLIPSMTNPGPRFAGRVVVDNGQFRWKSETTGRTGTFVLHEGEGRRVLVSRADDGTSAAEATPAQ
jgi:hypothetical protein